NMGCSFVVGEKIGVRNPDGTKGGENARGRASERNRAPPYEGGIQGGQRPWPCAIRALTGLAGRLYLAVRPGRPCRVRRALRRGDRCPTNKSRRRGRTLHHLGKFVIVDGTRASGGASSTAGDRAPSTGGSDGPDPTILAADGPGRRRRRLGGPLRAVPPADRRLAAPPVDPRGRSRRPGPGDLPGGRRQPAIVHPFRPARGVPVLAAVDRLLSELRLLEVAVPAVGGPGGRPGDGGDPAAGGPGQPAGPVLGRGARPVRAPLPARG